MNDTSHMKTGVALALLMQIAGLLATVPFYGDHNLHVDWRSFGVGACGVALVAALAAATWGQRERDGVCSSALALAIILTAGFVFGPAQYLAVALRRPLVDGSLAAADAALGISVPAVTMWTAQHPALVAVLTVAYNSLLVQFGLTILLVGAVGRDFEKLWEYIWHFHFCLVVTISCLALWPAACVFSHSGVPSLLPQQRFVEQFTALRAGTFHLIRFTEIEGLISFPSFHVAGGLMVTWAMRGRRAVWPVGALNVAMIASTVFLGAHYFIDIIATAAMFGVSVAAYWALGRVRAVRAVPLVSAAGAIG
jgi:hypothetical protein